jgi:hypothetical protein
MAATGIDQTKCPAVRAVLPTSSVRFWLSRRSNFERALLQRKKVSLIFCALHASLMSVIGRGINPTSGQKEAFVFVKFEDILNFGMKRFETVTTATASTTKGLQAIAAEAADYSKKSFESTCAFAEKLRHASKPDEIVDMHSSFAKSAYDDFFNKASKIGQIYSNLAKEAFQELTREAPVKTAPVSQPAAAAAAPAPKAPVASQPS